MSIVPGRSKPAFSENYAKVGLKFWEEKLGRETSLDKLNPQWIDL
jgi:hypothetical protein